MFTYDYYFKSGSRFSTGEIDHIKEIVNLGIYYNIIEQTGSWYKIEGESIQGLQKLAEVCRERPDFIGDAYNKIKVKYQQ